MKKKLNLIWSLFMNELQELDRDALIHRLVSIEFNRFLEYYKNAPDLNADVWC
jgi:ATP-dependent RNA helicase DeaD